MSGHDLCSTLSAGRLTNYVGVLRGRGCTCGFYIMKDWMQDWWCVKMGDAMGVRVGRLHKATEAITIAIIEGDVE